MTIKTRQPLKNKDFLNLLADNGNAKSLNICSHYARQPLKNKAKKVLKKFSAKHAKMNNYAVYSLYKNAFIAQCLEI